MNEQFNHLKHDSILFLVRLKIANLLFLRVKLANRTGQVGEIIAEQAQFVGIRAIGGFEDAFETE